VAGGTGTLGTINLTSPVGSSGLTIALTSSNPFVEVPPTITVPPGAWKAYFPVITTPCGTAQSATIAGTGDSGSGNFSLNLGLTPYAPSIYLVKAQSTYVVGGGTTSATVQLDHFVTSAGGEIVSLSTSNSDGTSPASATVPSSVTVPFGSNSATFTVTTSTVTVVTGVNIIATDGGTSEGLIVVMPPSSLGLSLSVNPGGVFGGANATGTVSLNTVQTADTVVSLSSSSAGVTVPATVTVPAGQLSASFTVSTTPVASQVSVLNGGWVWISASSGIASQSTEMSIYPSQLHAVTTSPGSVAGGASATGTVTLAGAAPAGGIAVTLSSNNAGVTVPSSVTVPAGSTSATFTVSTVGSVSAYYATISASYSGLTKTTKFGVGTSVLVHSISASPGSVTGGASSTGTVTLNTAAPTDLVINLNSTSSLVTVPASVTIPAGQSSATFGISTAGTLTATTSTLTASLAGKTVSCGFGVGASTLLRSISASPGTLTGGQGSVGTVTLTANAPAGGAVISLSASSGAVQVPATVTVPAGSLSTTFSVMTTPVAANTSVTLTASAAGISKTCGFMVGIPTLVSLTTTTPTVQGGDSLTVTAALSGPAPTGGMVVQLSSGSSSASVPNSVTIPEGETSASFTVTTSAVTGNTSVTLTGVEYSTIHLTVTLTH